MSLKKKDRIEQLENFMKEQPQDPFFVYALALEYVDDDDAKAESYFIQTYQNFPSYLPLYYHAAMFYDKLGQVDKARVFFLKGIELAKSTDAGFALKELENAYQNFEFLHS
ncbi:MAG: tetratricopeptide repeat protein [Cytophagales bacterium]|nr:MAG: tetratricopeptide repeat protein [Cytophagales bacterium]TAF60760.1 MAG: tetratricopeptide repeat protein [Cytophagales bacterium]